MRIEEKKKDQGYNPKPSLPICGNCLHYLGKVVVKSDNNLLLEWNEEVNKKCGLGDFAVKKTATCEKYVFKGSKI